MANLDRRILMVSGVIVGVSAGRRRATMPGARPAGRDRRPALRRGGAVAPRASARPVRRDDRAGKASGLPVSLSSRWPARALAFGLGSARRCRCCDTWLPSRRQSRSGHSSGSCSRQPSADAATDVFVAIAGGKHQRACPAGASASGLAPRQHIDHAHAAFKGGIEQRVPAVVIELAPAFSSSSTTPS